MLVQYLISEFKSTIEQENKNVLWFDPNHEWEGLIPELEKQLPLIVYDGSLLHIRYKLVTCHPDENFVVYLPFKSIQYSKRSEAEYLRPFLYTARVFDDSIETVLRKQGIDLPQGLGRMRDIRPHLPALVSASIGKGRAFWEGIESLDSVLARLLPDFEITLMRLLTFPKRTILKLDEQGQKAPFLTLLENEFGVQIPEEDSEEEWANQFTAILCLVETFVTSGKPDDFPFMQVLPDPVYWNRCRDFLRKWQYDEMFNDSFSQRARKIDHKYDLSSWVRKLSDLPSPNSLLNIEKTIWEEIYEELDKVSNKEEAVTFCRSYKDIFTDRKDGFWAREGTISGWLVLYHMSEVIFGVINILDEVTDIDTPQRLIEKYAESWWQADKDYRVFRDKINQSIEHLDSARKWTQRVYLEYIESINIKLYDLVQGVGIWPPDGLAVGEMDLWGKSAQQAMETRAIIFVDALRYELGKDLLERLKSGLQVQLNAGLSPVPSITPLGMAVLLPGWREFKVDYHQDGWEITSMKHKGNIAEKKGRLSWLKEKLNSVEFYNLDEFLSLPISGVKKDKDWLIISSAEIDAVGESAGPVTWHTTNALINRLVQAIRRLLALEFSEVHILSDHGFLLRDNVRDSEKVAVDIQEDILLKRSERYLIIKDGKQNTSDLLSLSILGSEDISAVIPRGLGCFFTPGSYDYMHGGLTLQEVVTAKLTVRQSLEERPVGVSLELVTGEQIRNAIFKVRLLPQDVDLLSRNRRVEIDVSRDDEQISDAWEVEVGKEPVEKSLRLSPQMGLEIGETISVRVWDADTRELLSKKDAVVEVDLDW